MKVSRNSLQSAVEAGILSKQQAQELQVFLEAQPGVGPSFNFTHVLYYFGGLIAIGAMSLFMTLGWETFGGWGVFFISLGYAGVGLKLTSVFQNRGLAVPAGICATFVVALSPLAIYGIQQGLGLWPDDSVYREYHHYVRWHWIYMQLGTLAIGVIMAWRYRYPFLVMPIAVTLWYLTMDITAIIAEGDVTWELRKLVSMFSGLLVIGLAFWVDFRSRGKADYAFWLYLFGVLAFWCGLTLQESDSELSKFFYFLINLSMIVIGVLLVRRVFVVFGALGCCFYLGHLAWDVFKDSWFFPIALTAIGLCIVYLGVLWQKHEKQLTLRLRAMLPEQLRLFLESKSQSL